jgi:hypothetical protein
MIDIKAYENIPQVCNAGLFGPYGCRSGFGAGFFDVGSISGPNSRRFEELPRCFELCQ